MRRWLKRAAAAVVAWLAVLAFAELTDHRPHLLALAAAVFAVLAVGWLGADAFQEAETPQWSLYRAPSPDRTFDPRFSRLSQDLDEAADRPAAARAVHASLRDVADRILQDGYGVDLERQPDAAREVLGDVAWNYLDAAPSPGKAVFSPAVFAVLDRLESL